MSLVTAQFLCVLRSAMCSSVSCTMRFPYGGIVGFKVVSTGCEQVHMSASSQQPVSISCFADQFSYCTRQVCLPRRATRSLTI